MLKWLKITNVALIEKCHISFESGFNILTGETGAGKTALTQALALLMGEKADPKMVRAGEERALVEASFEIDKIPSLISLLEEQGINVDLSEELLVKREIVLNGKNKSHIAGAQVSSSVVRDLSELLIERATQNATHKLRTSEEQLRIIDSAHLPLLALYSTAYRDLKAKESSINELLLSRGELAEKLELYRHQLNDIEKLEFQEGEEDELFAEYRTLSTSQEMISELSEVRECLESLPSLQSLVAPLKKYGLEEVSHLIASAGNEIIEASFQLASKLSETNFDAERFDEIESRLSDLAHAKKKYGDLKVKEAYLRDKIAQFENFEERLEKLQAEQTALEKEVICLAGKLREARKKQAEKLSEQVTHEIQALNMPSARILIEVKEAKRTTTGEDEIIFWLAANPGEPPVTLQDRASGGELSRIFFALKMLFAESENLPILIFDEVDANIGGETATLIGEKLKTLGQKRQVIAITHFPQVAKQADHHLRVEKEEREGRTLTQVKPLTPPEQKEEILRMLGGTFSDALLP